MAAKILKIVLTAHAVSGCDTKSALFQIEKKKIYLALKKMLSEDLRRLQNLSKVSLDEAVKIVTNFLSLAYDPSNKSKSTNDNINSLRYNLEIKKNSAIDRLLPSEPALKQHLLRALWQFNEWQHAIDPQIQSLLVTEYGWLQDNNILSPVYFEGNAAMEFLQKYFCNYSSKKSCSSTICPCKELNLFCCEVCNCSENCENKFISNNEEILSQLEESTVDEI